ncbi:MAG: tetratricopeptide repeat protein [Armatimonadetes bacterium]|nr:tetratricopeptide repeat protein [Armatimonadota bacterium]
MIATDRLHTPGLTLAAVMLGVAAAVILPAPADRAEAQGTAPQWPSLIRRYEQQVALAPADPHTRFTLAVLYARDGRLLEAYNQIQAADQAVGDPAQRLPLIGQVISEAEERLRQTPADLLARYRLAFAKHFAGDRLGGIAEMQRIIAAEPRNEWGYGYLGAGYATAGQDEQAIATWERGLQVNPRNAVLHYLLGLAYGRKGDKKKAAAHLAIAYRDRTLYEYVTGSGR